MERATSFYERYLWDAEAGAPARAHLEARGFGEEVCREFRLGLAPGGATLARGAVKEGFTREELAAAGLVNRRGNDYFNGRLLSRSPMRAAGSAASRPGDCATTTRFRPSTSTRPRASSSARAISCTAWTRPGARSQSRTAR